MESEGEDDQRKYERRYRNSTWTWKCHEEGFIQQWMISVPYYTEYFDWGLTNKD